MTRASSGLAGSTSRRASSSRPLPVVDAGEFGRLEHLGQAARRALARRPVVAAQEDELVLAGAVGQGGRARRRGERCFDAGDARPAASARWSLTLAPSSKPVSQQPVQQADLVGRLAIVTQSAPLPALQRLKHSAW